MSLRLTLLLCVAGTSTLVAQTSGTPPRNRDRDLITREELVASAQKNQDLMKAVRSLRSHFLRPPSGTRSMTGPPPAPVQLYVDGIRLSEVAMLETIQTIDAEEVRYLDPGKAQDLYGITHNGGAIVVKRYKGPRPDPTPP